MASHVKCHDASCGHGNMGKDALETPCTIIIIYIIIVNFDYHPNLLILLAILVVAATAVATAAGRKSRSTK